MFVLRDHQLGRCMLKSAGTIDICFYLSDEIGNDCFSGQTIKLSIRFLSLLFFFIFFVFEKFLVSYFYLIAIKFVRLRTLNRLNTSDDSSIVFHSFIHVFFSSSYSSFVLSLGSNSNDEEPCSKKKKKHMQMCVDIYQ